MKPYHFAWLMRHPERTSDWLKRQLKDGFDIHHLDGNHENNNPDNLVLIECRDHMMLHGNEVSRVMNLRRLKEAQRVKSQQSNVIGRQIYTLREKGYPWRKCYEVVLRKDDPHHAVSRAITAAKRYATENAKPWPIKL